MRLPSLILEALQRWISLLSCLRGARIARVQVAREHAKFDSVSACSLLHGSVIKLELE